MAAGLGEERKEITAAGLPHPIVFRAGSVGLTKRDDLPINGLRLVVLPCPVIEMPQVIPPVGVGELYGQSIPAQRLLGAMRKAKDPKVPRRLGAVTDRIRA